MTIGADAGPASANAATEAAARISFNLSMFPPARFAERTRAARLPTFYASGTNTEKPKQMPLPFRRDLRNPCCSAKRNVLVRQISTTRSPDGANAAGAKRWPRWLHPGAFARPVGSPGLQND